MSFSNVHFILFKPQLAENIGACARALKNFNFTKLKLVSPKISFPNEKVYATSVGARDIIKSSKIYNNFEDAIKDVDCVIATSSRIRKKNYKYLSLSKLKKIDFKKKIAIIFGPEASGLTNNELSYANYLIKLPTNNNFQSLNLSHCVILFCYEIFKILNKKTNRFNSRYKSKPINKKNLNKFVNFLISSLDQIGFLQPNHKRKSMIQNLRTIFHKMNLSNKEMRLLLGIFSSLKDKKGSLTN
jgi:tRNA/rRNA methyltransferase